MIEVSASSVRRAVDYLAGPRAFPLTRAEFALCVKLLDAKEAGTYDGSLASAIKVLALAPEFDLTT